MASGFFIVLSTCCAPTWAECTGRICRLQGLHPVLPSKPGVDLPPSLASVPAHPSGVQVVTKAHYPSSAV